GKKQGLKCYSCGKEGHYARDYRSRKVQLQQNYKADLREVNAIEINVTERRNPFAEHIQEAINVI
ncbi:hypothetical protein LTS14_010977, partial [Recurvomyces mirabilis]|uniref:uncharacterized protein n=1 Tax=Recurvomyces mirabilis TaxID=574656 RepID=UPI002DDE90BF